MINKRLKAFLDEHQTRYKTTIHSPAYTAQQTAQSTHIHGLDFMKTVIAQADGEFIMLVLPAPYRIDIEELKSGLDAENISLASETDFYKLFPQCELGAMPPFGNLFELTTYVAPCFGMEQSIAFNAGSHAEVIQMRFADYIELIKPRILEAGYAAPTATPRRMKEHGGKNFNIH